jgi:DNA-directed RNA polymerase specialized sigma24 family protein
LICCSISGASGIILHVELDAPSAPEEEQPGSFAEFYRDERSRAVRLVWLLTHDPSACDDIVQDAFVAVYTRFDSLDDPAAYLRVVLMNRVAERARRSTRERRRAELVDAGSPATCEGPTGGLVDAIAALPLNQRTAVVLRYWADLDHHQIAHAMQVRPGTVRSLLSRATARLREAIEQ